MNKEELEELVDTMIVLSGNMTISPELFEEIKKVVHTTHTGTLEPRDFIRRSVSVSQPEEDTVSPCAQRLKR